MKENQSVRMEELLTRILFVSPLNRVEDRVDLEGVRDGAMEIKLGGRGGGRNGGGKRVNRLLS